MKPFLSASMIVKNEALGLETALEKLKPYFDEIIVVDTGSSDRTPAIAREAGAKVFHFKWGNDFSRARNFSLAKASGSWIFVLDADEFLELSDLKNLRDFLAGAKADVFYCPVLAVSQSSLELTPEKREVLSLYFLYRLFRNSTKIKFFGRVHESIYPAIARYNLKVAQLPWPIYHFGYDPALKNHRQKMARNLGYLMAEAQEFPERADTLFELGRAFSFFPETKEEALFYLQKAIKKRYLELALKQVGQLFFSRGTSLYYMHYFLAEVYLAGKKYQKALVESAKATIFRNSKEEIEPLYLMGICHKKLGNLTAGRTAFEILEKIVRPFDLNNLGHHPGRPHLLYSTLINLAEILIKQNQLDLARAKIQKIKELNYPLPKKWEKYL